MRWGEERWLVANVGFVAKIRPNCFDSHEKESASIFECFRAVELCVKCLTKRDKVWVNELIVLKGNSSFSQRLWISVFQRTRFEFLVWKKRHKNRKGACYGGSEWNDLPLFSVLIYLLLFIKTLLLKLFCETKSRVGHRSQSCKKLHCAKDFGSTSSYTWTPF